MNIQEIITFLQTDFIVKALIGGVLFAVLAPLIGHFMVFRGYSGISDGISHIALVGLAVGLIIGSFSLIWAFSITIALALGMEYLRQRHVLRAETSITFFVILSLSLVSIFKQLFGLNRSLESLLFGSITSLTLNQIILTAGLLIITSAFVLIRYKQLMYVAFNEELAAISGIKVALINYTLIAIVACVVVVGIDIIGGLLVSSLMILPVAAAAQLKQGFISTHCISICISIVCVIIGIMLSWFINLPASAAIALCSVVIFIISLCYSSLFLSHVLKH